MTCIFKKIYILLFSEGMSEVMELIDLLTCSRTLQQRGGVHADLSLTTSIESFKPALMRLNSHCGFLMYTSKRKRYQDSGDGYVCIKLLSIFFFYLFLLINMCPAVFISFTCDGYWSIQGHGYKLLTSLYVLFLGLPVRVQVYTNIFCDILAFVTRIAAIGRRELT